MSQQQARILVKDGEPRPALELLITTVKKHPSDLSSRVFLFELLAVLGDWSRAKKQLQVIRELGDSDSLLMFLTYSQALEAERIREQVFSGQRQPLVMGEPEAWFGYIVQALALFASGQTAKAAKLRNQAFETAPVQLGELNETPFDWIADADSRLGPCLEAIVNGEYYWIPFSRITAIFADAPATLRDLVWLPASFEWSGGGESVGLVPVRYPGSEAAGEGAVNLGRTTLWNVGSDDYATGMGQRQLTTSVEDIGLLDLRSLTFEAGEGRESQVASGETVSAPGNTVEIR